MDTRFVDTVTFRRKSFRGQHHPDTFRRQTFFVRVDCSGFYWITGISSARFKYTGSCDSVRGSHQADLVNFREKTYFFLIWRKHRVMEET